MTPALGTSPPFAGLHSPKLTWKPIQPLLKGTVVFIGPFLGFHVSFQECRVLGPHFAQGLWLYHGNQATIISARSGQYL